MAIKTLLIKKKTILQLKEYRKQKEVKWKSKLQKTETLLNAEINQFKADLEDKRKLNEYNEKNLQEMKTISILKGRKFEKEKQKNKDTITELNKKLLQYDKHIINT